MKYLIDKSIREHYKTSGWALIPSMISPEICHDAYFSGKSQWMKASSLKQALLDCQDMARNIPFFQKWAFSKDLAGLAQELTLEKTLNFGFDQAFFEEEKEDKESLFKEDSRSLEEDIPLQGFCLSYFVFLKDKEEEREKEESVEENLSPLKQAFQEAKAGDILFVRPNTPFSIEEALQSKRAFDFVVLLSKNAVFNLKPTLFFSAPFKRKGAQFGDKLTSSEFKSLI